MGEVKRKVRYRLYPSKRQTEALLRLLGLHQRLYNALIEQRIHAYKRQRISLGFYDQCKEITLLRRESEEYRELSAQACQVTAKRVDLAFQHFFRRLRERKSRAGFPRFRAFNRFSGWGYKSHGDGWRLHAGKGMKHGHLRISGVGALKIRGTARTQGIPKTLEILHQNGRWYASVTISCMPQRNGGNSAVGIDWGVETFATIVDSEGKSRRIENPRHLRTSLAVLQKAQKNLSRKKRGSNNRSKARKQVAKIHASIANKRKNFIHQTSSKLVAKSALIATEGLNIKSMTTSGGAYKRGLNREILSTAPAAFFQTLRYKAEEAGIEWIDVPTRQVKPSQTCHRCFRRKKKSLSERRHRCVCGVACSRDENAARVMIAWALRPKGQELAFCGEAALAASMKQETPSIAA